MSPLPNDYYFGCGFDLSLKKAYEKWLLNSDSARAESEVWKELITLKLSEPGHDEVDVDKLTGTPHHPQYTCHPCFFGYRRLKFLQRELLEKVGHVVTK